MITIKDHNKRLKKLNLQIKSAETKLHALEQKRKALEKYPFKCTKCGYVYTEAQCGYKIYVRRTNDMRYAGVGDYDCREVEVEYKRACCPKCGKDFKKDIGIIREVDSTGWYDRHDSRAPWKGNFDRPADGERGERIHRCP